MIISIILMMIAHAVWALHDLYFWGSDKTKAFVRRVGWHNIKMVMKIMFFFSAFIAGRISIGMSLWIVCKTLLVLVMIAWGAFEGAYNILHKDARLFDWARYLGAALTKKEFKDMPMSHALQLKESNVLEFVLHHCFRLHWVEAFLIIILSVILL